MWWYIVLQEARISYHQLFKKADMFWEGERVVMKFE